MPTKTPSTKAASKKPAAAKPAKTPAAAAHPKGDDAAKKPKRGPKATAKPGAARDAEDGDGDGDEDEDDEEEFVPKKAPGSKPATETAVVPARRLTPEAKAQINAMVQKGVPLDEALRRAASWETFVAPVKDETQKAFPGKDGAGPRSPFGGRRPSGPRDKSDKNDSPGGGFNFEDEDPGISLGDDEPIVAGGDDD